MSRIGQKPISVPEGVNVKLDGRTVHAEGPKGRLSWTHRPEVSVELDASGKTITVSRRDNQRQTRALHGTTRALIANMVQGCDRVLLSVGFAHPRSFEIPQGLTVMVETPQARGDTDPARFTVSGADKQAVGELASELRSVRPPEPYKGKGIRYAGEYVRRKVGKAFAGAGIT
ncbi:MAG: 50S ribosomal protein L6 [Planctomycetota bacterium]|jgi:large subunit ribosomal protein L6